MSKLSVTLLIVLAVASTTMAQINRRLICKNSFSEENIICPDRKEVTIINVESIHIAANLPQQCERPSYSYETIVYQTVNTGTVQQACKYRFPLGRSECVLDANALSLLFRPAASLPTTNNYDLTPIRAQIDYTCTGNAGNKEIVQVSGLMVLVGVAIASKMFNF